MRKISLAVLVALVAGGCGVDAPSTSPSAPPTPGAPARIELSATSGTGATGGSATITARVQDAYSATVPGVMVTFSSIGGTLSATSVTDGRDRRGAVDVDSGSGHREGQGRGGLRDVARNLGDGATAHRAVRAAARLSAAAALRPDVAAAPAAVLQRLDRRVTDVCRDRHANDLDGDGDPAGRRAGCDIGDLGLRHEFTGDGFGDADERAVYLLDSRDLHREADGDRRHGDRLRDDDGDGHGYAAAELHGECLRVPRDHRCWR